MTLYVDAPGKTPIRGMLRPWGTSRASPGSSSRRGRSGRHSGRHVPSEGGEAVVWEEVSGLDDPAYLDNWC
jgi:hypothetical protein